MKTNLLKTLLICVLSFNLVACVGDNIADEMKTGNAQINELTEQLTLLNARLNELKGVEADVSRLNIIFLQILDIIRKLPPLKQQEVLKTMDPDTKKLIVDNIGE